jgi:hypothetical protein
MAHESGMTVVKSVQCAKMCRVQVLPSYLTWQTGVIGGSGAWSFTPLEAHLWKVFQPDTWCIASLLDEGLGVLA